jgi:ATP-binding cassette subfamily F protein uup
LEELSQTQNRNQQKKASIAFSASHRETRKLLIGTNLFKELGEKILFQHLNFTISPGTRIGLMGPNGSGKTTLLRIMAGEISPDQGTLKTADNLKVVYFDQHRNLLPLNITLRQALSPQGDFVDFHGQKIHVNGWCKRFLFTPDILDMPLKSLSGGERARIAIAHLMLQPADVLLLDEPTNDLDIATLETLEESLLEFPGAVVLITHDRSLLERVCNTLLALGTLDHSFFADYHQWEASLKKIMSLEKNKEKKSTQSLNKTKLTYAEKKEHAQIEDQIAKMEQEIRDLNLLLENPAIAQDPAQLQSVCAQVGLAEVRLEQAYLRWDFLEKKLE